MSRASIFDQLHQRRSPAKPVEAPTAARSDYAIDQLRLIDAVALTASGFVGRETMPTVQSPTLSSTLHGPDGFRLLVHEITDVMPVNDARLRRLESKAVRLHGLIQTLVIEALMMLEALPEDTPFDVVLTAPLRSREAIDIVVGHLRAAIVETQYATALGVIRHAPRGDDPHAVLAVGDGTGMPHVLWISVDSLLNDEDIALAQRQGLLKSASKGNGLYPGESVSALLMQRLTAEQTRFDSGWCLGAGTVLEHAPRAHRRDHLKRQSMIELLAQTWRLPASPDEAAPPGPVRVVIDALGLSGRAVEVGGALVEHWPELDVIDDGAGVDQCSGWPGEACVALALTLAMATLSAHEEAVVIGVFSESRSTGWGLRAWPPLETADNARAGGHS